MLSVIEKYKLNRAVESYINELGPALVKRYGGCDQYTVMQVEKTARSLNLGMQYISYAIALYRKDESVNTIDLYRIDQGFLDMLREEIAAAYFGGDIAFSAMSVVDLGRPRGWGGGVHRNWIANIHGKTGF